MSVDDLLMKLESMRAGITSGFSPADKLFIEQHYYLITGIPFVRRNCANCYADALIEMTLEFKKNQKFKKQMSKFILKRGTLLISPGIKSVVSGRHIATNDALEHLAAHPEKIKQFEEYPDNWKRLVENFQSTRTKNEPATLDPPTVKKIAWLLSEGTTKKRIREDFKGYQLNGKVLTARQVNEYIQAAQLN